MNPQYAKYLVEKTQKDFNLIGEDFSRTRQFVWPLIPLKKHIRENERILDLGCGNGRLFELFKDKTENYIGIDFSSELVRKAREKYGEHFKTANILSLPFSNDYFDSVWSVAVLHHIPSKELRGGALKEINRVLKKGGKAIIIVWNLYQFYHFKLLLKFFIKKVLNKSNLDFKDVFIPWKNKNVERYYHAFTKKEIKKLLINSGFKIEELRFLKQNNKKNNLLIIGEKT